MRKVIFAAIILLSCFGTCFGQAIKPDTLTIYGTFPVYGREAEWMEDQLNIWKPNLAEIRVVNDWEMSLYEKTGFKVVGRYKNFSFVDGKYRDAIIMEKEI